MGTGRVALRLAARGVRVAGIELSAAMLARMRAEPGGDAGAGGSAWRTSVPFRYVWPRKLDLMARPAGMSLRDRWADGSRSPFTDDSESHVSVWVVPPA